MLFFFLTKQDDVWQEKWFLVFSYYLLFQNTCSTIFYFILKMSYNFIMYINHVFYLTIVLDRASAQRPINLDSITKQTRIQHLGSLLVAQPLWTREVLVAHWRPIQMILMSPNVRVNLFLGNYDSYGFITVEHHVCQTTALQPPHYIKGILSSPQYQNLLILSTPILIQY